MLRLREHVRRRELRVGRPVGDDQHLARPGDLIDVGLAVAEPLGGRDVDVPRPDDLVDARHRLGAVSQGGNRLRAADAVEGVHAREMAGGEDDGRGAGRHHDHLIHPREPRRNDRHQDGGRIECTPARHVHSDALQGCDAQAQARAAPIAEPPRALALPAVKGADAPGGERQIAPHLGGERTVRRRHRRGRDAELARREPHPVELPREGEERAIAPSADGRHDAADPCLDGCPRRAAARLQTGQVPARPAAPGRTDQLRGGPHARPVSRAMSAPSDESFASTRS